MASQQKSEQETVHEITEENNIFRLRVADALAYLVFYVAIPIFTAYASLARQSMSNVERMYSYVTIMILFSIHWLLLFLFFAKGRTPFTKNTKKECRQQKMLNERKKPAWSIAK